MKTIIWDVDDVLNDCLRSWLKYWKKQHPGCLVQYSEIKENPPHPILGVSFEEYAKSLDDFKTSGLYGRLKPNSEILRWFRNRGKKYRHLALTATSMVSAPASAQWVFKHFGKWIRTYHFVPSRRQGQKIPEYERDKTAYLKLTGRADLIVEDNPQNLRSAEQLGIKGILVPQPWNQGKGSISRCLNYLIM